MHNAQAVRRIKPFSDLIHQIRDARRRQAFRFIQQATERHPCHEFHRDVH